MSAVESAQKKCPVELSKMFARRIHKLTKLAKPLLKLLSRKTNAVTPSTCNYDVIESLQNRVNESTPFQVSFKFHEERTEEDENALNEERTEEDENALNEALEKRILQEGTYHAVPVRFVEKEGRFWMLPDGDLSLGSLLSEGQVAECQAPC